MTVYFCDVMQDLLAELFISLQVIMLPSAFTIVISQKILLMMERLFKQEVLATSAGTFFHSQTLHSLRTYYVHKLSSVLGS